MNPLVDQIYAANQELLVEGNLNAIKKHFAQNFVAHGTNRDLKGHADLRKFIRMLHRAFSDIEVDIEVLVESGDRVSWQRTVRAKHTGPIFSFPATGAPIVWRDMVTSRFEDGYIAEDWSITDLAEHLLRGARKPR